MSEQRQILFVTPEAGEVEHFIQQLPELRDGWQFHRAENAGAALELFQSRPMDVVLCDVDLPDLNGADLLDEVWKSQPKSIRFLRALTIDNDLMMRCVWGSHRLLQKPTDPELLKSSILRSLELEVWLGNKSIRSLVSRMRTFPVMPSLYQRVVRELDSPTSSASNIAEIISKDLAMTTKIIQVVNSAMYGLQRQITDLTEAIHILGMETVKALVLAIHAFAQMDKVKPLYFSIDRIWKHGMAVGALARRIVQLEAEDPVMAEEAFTAGLLHDIGKVILATNLDEHYNGAMNLARKRNIPPWEVEAEVFGATHAETGAYLLALWGLPARMVEATALHHHPGAAKVREFSPLTAVHAANVLEQSNPSEDGLIAAAFEETYLGELGLEDHIEAWRDLQSNAFSARALSGTRIMKKSDVAAAPASAGRAGGKLSVWQWLSQTPLGKSVAAAGVGLALVILFAVLMQCTASSNDHSAPASQR